MSQNVPNPCAQTMSQTEPVYRIFSHLWRNQRVYSIQSMTSLFICWTCHREVAIRVCIFCVYVVRVDVIVPTSQKGRAFGGEGFCFVPWKTFVRKGYVAASFDIQQDASQAGCCVVCWEMLHATEYGGLVHVFSCFSSPRKIVVLQFCTRILRARVASCSCWR